MIKKYQPKRVRDIKGQPSAVQALSSFAHAAHGSDSPHAFLFHGPSGTGKTSAAWALAADLGCDTSDPWMSGINEIPSGRQDGGAVDELLHALRLRPLFGSGWKVAIINEADQMTRQAEAIWLDGLEHLPRKTVVVFTTNEPAAISARLMSRCEAVAFSGDPLAVGPALARHIRAIWKRETGGRLEVLPDGLGLFDIAGGTISFRLALQQIAPFLRDGRELPPRFGVPIVRDSDAVQNAVGSQAARKAWATRRERQVS